jgi:predicted nucleic acid-binding protein
VTDAIAVTNSSPLIAFYQIDRLELLRSLFRAVVAPPAVAREIAPSLGALPTWISERHFPTTPNAVMSLDAGEREVIALALHVSADVIILDDLEGRRKAAQLGLDVIGSAGILIQALRRGFIDAVRPELDAMIANGFYVSSQLYREVLAAAGEEDPWDD